MWKGILFTVEYENEKRQYAVTGAVYNFILRSNAKQRHAIIPQTFTNDNYIDDNLS